MTARRAGAHIDLESGDNLETGCGILSIHSTSRGKKSIALPAPALLAEIFTGETADGSSGRAEFEMEALTTRVFLLDSCGK